MKFDKVTIIKFGILFLTVVFIAFVFLDQLFSKPEIHTGIIIEKVKIEKDQLIPRVVPYRGMKSTGGTMTISSTPYPQQIAIVESDEGEVLRVHCTSEHYEQKKKGDTILFKKYSGHLVAVKYLSHSEEDTVQTDWNKVFKH